RLTSTVFMAILPFSHEQPAALRSQSQDCQGARPSEPPDGARPAREGRDERHGNHDGCSSRSVHRIETPCHPEGCRPDRRQEGRDHELLPSDLRLPRRVLFLPRSNGRIGLQAAAGSRRTEQTVRPYVAETVGTFALVFAGTGAIVINDVSGGAVTHAGI